MSDGLELAGPEPPSSELGAVAFSPDGVYLVYGLSDGTIDFWEIAEETIAFSLPGNEGKVFDLAFSADGAILASAGGTIQLWSVEDRRILATLEAHKNIISDVAFSPDGRLIASSSADGSVIIWGISE